MDAASRDADHLSIEGGLGAVPSCELTIRPFTVFVGRRGTGKSLVAQSLYLFEELPFLLARALTERGNQKEGPEQLFRWVIDRLRSSDRAFATFANPNVAVTWRTGRHLEWPLPAPRLLKFRAFRATRQVTVRGTSGKYLERLIKQLRNPKTLALHHAIFIPTERIVISQLRSAMSERLLSLPITYELFSHWMDDHAVGVASNWTAPSPESDAAVIEALGRDALGGSARRHGERWKWQVASKGGRNTFDLDMASSGQRANWSLPFLARALLELRGTGDVAQDLTLFVEEPEIHLHPGAQREIVKLLALMVNRGFRVVLTTHSITLLYALNNLIQASQLPSAVDAADVPGTPLRLNPADVSVYLFEPDAKPRQLLDDESGFIDERALGSVNDELSAELNRIVSRMPEQAG